MKIAMIVSEFNRDVTQRLLDSALYTFNSEGFNKEDIDVIWVPGAVEIPLVAKRLAQQDFSAILAFGCVIRGQTGHYDYVCDQVSQGCQQVMLDYEVPIIFGVLTTNNRQQALARAGGEHSDKGRECAMAAIQMIKVMKSLNPVMDTV